MTPERFKTIRESYGSGQAEFGRQLGYSGTDATVARKVRRIESGERAIDGPLERLLELMAFVRLV